MASDRQSLPPPVEAERSRQVSRRGRRNSERVKVTRACDRCKRRKIKCNGTQPCELCSKANADCTFNTAYARGRVPRIPPTAASEAAKGNENANGNGALSVEDMMTPSKSPSVSEPPSYSTLLPSTETSHHENGHEALQGQQDHVSSSYLEPSSTSAYVPASTQNSPEPSQTDLQGHYIGPASGVSFLLRVQKRLHQAISFSEPGSIFTFGDAPLQPPDVDPSFCMMLPRDDAQRLVDRYFDFAMPTYRFLHRPTIQEWFNEFYDTLGVMHDAQNAPAKVALLFMVFAHARVYMPDNDRPGPPDLSTRYFFAAEHQLTKEKGSIRLTSVQARLTQCYYLLTQSRINHCWSLFGTVSHLAMALGLNRNRRPDPGRGLSVVESECRRRTFWCAYTLDAYLSVALGRPRSFHDEDIDTELPACVDDHELATNHMGTSSAPTRGPSIMLASLAHNKLARIIGRIVSGLYPIKPVSASRRATLTREIAEDLGDWRAELAWFLDVDTLSTSLLIPLYQRQRNVLNLTYEHAIILTHRPSMLSNFARLSQPDPVRGESVQTEESVQQCLLAAMKTVNTIDDITRNRGMYRAFWTTAYFAFTATVVLYIYVIQKRSSPPDVYSHYFHAAVRCQSHISAVAEKASLSERYCLVLEELRLEAIRQTRHMHPSTTIGLDSLDSNHLHGDGSGGFPAGSMHMDASPSTVANYQDLMGDATIDFNGMPAPTLSDFSGWGQFASMVSSGLGNLDAFLNEDSLRY